MHAVHRLTLFTRALLPHSSHNDESRSPHKEIESANPPLVVKVTMVIQKELPDRTLLQLPIAMTAMLVFTVLLYLLVEHY